MTYDQKFQLVRKSLITHCNECISENWKKMWDTDRVIFGIPALPGLACVREIIYGSQNSG